MTQLLWIGLGGGLGAVLRHSMIHAVVAYTPLVQPMGTMLVNITGSFLLGLFITISVRFTGLVGPELKLFIAIGLLGGFTTFSTFSLESVQLLQQGQLWQAVAMMVSTVLLCLVGTILGMALGRFDLAP